MKYEDLKQGQIYEYLDHFNTNFEHWRRGEIKVNENIKSIHFTDKIAFIIFPHRMHRLRKAQPVKLYES